MGPVSTVLARAFLAGRGGLPRRVNIPLPLSHMSMWRLLLSPMSMLMDMVDIMGAVSTILARVFLAETGGLPRRVNMHQSQSHMSMQRLLPSPMSMLRFPLSHTKELLLMVDTTGAVSTILARAFLAETGGLPRRVNIHLPQSPMSMWRFPLSPTKELLPMVHILEPV